MNNNMMISCQDSNSPTMDYMLMFHDLSMLIIFMIMSLILYFIIFLIFNKFCNLSISQGQLIEIFWTILPIFILMLLAIPSLQLLYMTEETYSPSMSIKSMGHQWYWSYEYADFKNLSFDSFMISDQLYSMNLFRLLDVDNHLITPINTPIRMIVSSTDVIHSWTIPSLAVKADAIPGRLNQTFFLCKRPGLFYGQCSEICGLNHSFMPICLEITSIKNFISWLLFMSKN